MLRIEKPEKTQALAPGESYALSPEELGGKIRFATIDDFEAETDTEKTGNFGDFQGKEESFWSGGLKVSKFNQ